MSANCRRWSHEQGKELGWTTLIVPPIVIGIGVSLGAIFAARGLADDSPARLAAPGFPVVDGKELFTREWQPRDPRAHGGDGLGPLFNDTSCVACHNQGGVGGGGSSGRNVNIVTQATRKTKRSKGAVAAPGGVPAAGSFVLHHSSTDAEFATWRQSFPRSHPLGGLLLGGMLVDAATTGRSPSVQVPGDITVDLPGGGTNGRAAMRGSADVTQRNGTALFGAGKIDRIDEQALKAAAARKFSDFPEVTGRVSRTNDGKVGRFGWKAQIAGLDEFVLTACAVELGLQVPGHEQPPLPYNKEYKAPGLDMDQSECTELILFVAGLPQPTRLTPEHPEAAQYVREGEGLFATVGCATCHVPKLADVEGIYSDLLLHDMGPGLSDAATSYGLLRHENPSPPGRAPAPKRADPSNDLLTPGNVVSLAREWRTPPLWGVRDSAPYLHDGRAETLEAAIAAHSGEAEPSRRNFQALAAADQQKLVGFLKTLVAPAQ